MKRTPLKKKSTSRTATIKQDIQDILRLIVTYRDGGCVLRDIRHCGAEARVEERKVISEPSVVIQADHLVTRGNSATYANYRLVVCLCKGCHAWKHWNEKEYDALVKTVLSKETVEIWDKAQEYRHQHRTEKMDWNMQLVGLQFILKDYEDGKIK